MNNKFNEGDKVRIKTDLIVDNKYDDCTFVSDMAQYRGKSAIVRSIYKSSRTVRYKLNIDDSIWFWSENMLNPACPKDMLKVGMIVEYRNGERRIVMKNCFTSEDGHMSLNSFTDDLTYNGYSRSKNLDVMKIYEVSNYIGNIKLIIDCPGNLIWKREEKPEVTELTLEEVAKKFNIPVESLRIKD